MNDKHIRNIFIINSNISFKMATYSEKVNDFIDNLQENVSDFYSVLEDIEEKYSIRDEEPSIDLLNIFMNKTKRVKIWSGKFPEYNDYQKYDEITLLLVAKEVHSSVFENDPKLSIICKRSDPTDFYAENEDSVFLIIE